MDIEVRIKTESLYHTFKFSNLSMAESFAMAARDINNVLVIEIFVTVEIERVMA